jgi:hypothetical protein
MWFRRSRENKEGSSDRADIGYSPPSGESSTITQSAASGLGPDPTRNHARRPGHDFRDMIYLEGWENQSVWGYDEGMGSFFAQLWRNGSLSDDPDVWLSGVECPYPWPSCIALGVFQVTRCDPEMVTRALGIAEPGARLRPSHELAAEADNLSGRACDPYLAAKRDALLWVLGRAEKSPGTGLGWNRGTPTAGQVAAELHLVTGRIYNDRANQRTHSGADEALWWALGR